jgi:hypothetical protein
LVSFGSFGANPSAAIRVPSLIMVAEQKVMSSEATIGSYQLRFFLLRIQAGIDRQNQCGGSQPDRNYCFSEAPPAGQNCFWARAFSTHFGR